MKILLRILLAPVFALLTILIWIATKIVEISAVVLNFIAIGTALGAICIIIDGRTASGIAGLIAAFCRAANYTGRKPQAKSAANGWLSVRFRREPHIALDAAAHYRSLI